MLQQIVLLQSHLLLCWHGFCKVVLHQGLRCLRIQNQSLEKEIQSVLEMITYYILI